MPSQLKGIEIMENYDLYRFYDATNNYLSAFAYSSKKECERAMESLKNQGLTIELLGYRFCKSGNVKVMTLARYEQF